MPYREKLVVLLPRAVDKGNLTVQARDFPLELFANLANAFVLTRIERATYFPEWAKVEITILRSAVGLDTFAGSGGEIPVQLDIGKLDSMTINLRNFSIDTDARITLAFVGWQDGEM